jgi:hypothetical protein
MDALERFRDATPWPMLGAKHLCWDPGVRRWLAHAHVVIYAAQGDVDQEDGPLSAAVEKAWREAGSGDLRALVASKLASALARLRAGEPAEKVGLMLVDMTRGTLRQPTEGAPCGGRAPRARGASARGGAAAATRRGPRDTGKLGAHYRSVEMAGQCDSPVE